MDVSLSRGEAIPLGDELEIKSEFLVSTLEACLWKTRTGEEGGRNGVFPRVYPRVDEELPPRFVKHADTHTRAHVRTRSVLFLASISGCSFSAKVSTAFVKIQCV